MQLYPEELIKMSVTPRKKQVFVLAPNTTSWKDVACKKAPPGETVSNWL